MTGPGRAGGMTWQLGMGLAREDRGAWETKLGMAGQGNGLAEHGRAGHNNSVTFDLIRILGNLFLLCMPSILPRQSQNQHPQSRSKSKSKSDRNETKLNQTEKKMKAKSKAKSKQDRSRRRNRNFEN